MIPRSLREQMTEENLIKRIDLWNFLKAHKDKPKDEFGGWLLGQEIRRTDKIIMAVDLWNDLVRQKLEKEEEKGPLGIFPKGPLRKWRPKEF